jgi:very-short-patch-repair endonuclease
MARSTHQGSVRALARVQHGVITRPQLIALDYSEEAIDHRVEKGRLFVMYRGVYAVGRRELAAEGEWMAAVLACGDKAALSQDSAAALFRVARGPTTPIHISTLGESRSRDGIEVHRRRQLNTTTHKGIPTTTPSETLIDLSATWPQNRLEAAIAEADRLDLISPDRLRKAAAKAGRRGAVLRKLLDRQTFRLTESELERYFLAIVRRTHLPLPETQVWFGPHRVDFHWPALSLVVETDGGRFHRTAAQQTLDRKKEHSLAIRGMTVLRFTHWQIRYEPASSAETLGVVATRLAG